MQILKPVIDFCIIKAMKEKCVCILLQCWVLTEIYLCSIFSIVSLSILYHVS